MREDTHVKTGDDTRDALVMNLGQQLDVRLRAQSLALRARQLVRPAQHDLRLGSGTRQFLDKLEIKPVAMQGAEITEDWNSRLILI